jgi:hypothetical protein
MSPHPQIAANANMTTDAAQKKGACAGFATRATSAATVQEKRARLAPDPFFFTV